MARTTPRSNYIHTCGFCQHEYSLTESGEVCGSCGSHQGCKKIVCPKCGYEEAEPPGWIINMTAFLSGLGKPKKQSGAEA